VICYDREIETISIESVHDQHFLDTHAVAEALAVLGLSAKVVSRFRPDDQRPDLVVTGWSYRKPQPVPPKVRASLIPSSATDLHGGRPLLRDPAWWCRPSRPR
jgi:hypothetical protein